MHRLIFILLLFFLPLEAEIPKILVGSPIRQKPAILQEFLESLDRLNQTDYTLEFYFIDDNTDEESYGMLQDFAYYHPKCHIQQAETDRDDNSYICDEISHYWKDSIIWKVARFKDQIIQYALDHDFDYLFLIDSDLVLHPETIGQLMEAKKEIISNIFWTIWTPGSMAMPQVWQMDEYTLFKREPGEVLSQEEATLRYFSFINMLKTKGIFEVGGLGACTLIARSAMEKGVRFEKIRNLSYWGEDRHFCIRASALGIKLYVDTHYPALHLYRESELAKVPSYLQGCQ